MLLHWKQQFSGESVRISGGTFLLGLAIAALSCVPPAGAQQQVMGVVIAAENAQIGGVAAAVGTNVYAGDALSTDTGGTLRLKVGTGQVFLEAATDADLEMVDNVPQATLTRGTLGFTTAPSAEFQVQTPAGLVRTVGSVAVYGRISIVTQKELLITANTGTLEIDRACETHEIHSTSTYRVTIEEGASRDRKCAGDKVISALNTHLVVKAVASVAAGTIGYFTYRELSESPSQMSN